MELALEILVGTYILLGALDGFRTGLIRKLIGLVSFALSLYLSFKFSYIIKDIIYQYLNNLSLNFIPGYYGEYLSFILVEHAINIVAFIIGFVFFQIVLTIVRKIVFKIYFKDKEKKKKGIWNRIAGGIYGGASNIIFAAALLMVIVPPTGLTDTIKNSEYFIAKTLYNTTIQVTTMMNPPNLQQEEEVEADYKIIVTMANNSISEQEAYYIFLTINLMADDIMNNHSNIKMLSEEIEAADVFESIVEAIDIFFILIYGYLGIAKLTADGNYNPRVVARAELLVFDTLELLQNSKWHNDLLGFHQDNELLGYILNIAEQLGVKQSCKDMISQYFDVVETS